MASDESRAPRAASAARVVVTMTAPDGDRLELVAYPDGGCGILRSGKPVRGSKSTPCRMEECGDELLRLAGLLLE